MNHSELKNCRLLYIGPARFFYDSYLMSVYIKLGVKVDFFPLYAPYNLKNTAKRKLFGAQINEELNIYYDQLKLKKEFDYILVRHEGYLIPDSIYLILKANNPNAKFINFHWDSIKPSYNYLEKIRYFDRVFSFDYKDCDKYSEVNYLPLFYIDHYEELRLNGNNTKLNNDILFIGAWRNEERIKLVKKTEAFCSDHRMNFYYYLYMPTLRKLKMHLRRNKPYKAKSKILGHDQIVKLFAQAKVIIDFPSSFQSGLTMRTFEALGAGKKLITTNSSIIKEPIYSPKYISIIDPSNFYIDPSFVNDEDYVIPEDIIRNYSIHSYAHTLLNY